MADSATEYKGGTMKRLVVSPIDPNVLESIFVTPGRNDPCHCGSGKKYKRCHEVIDRSAWRTVALLSRQADLACAFLRSLAPSDHLEFNPDPLPEV
jgi:hypothetical protein